MLIDIVVNTPRIDSDGKITSTITCQQLNAVSDIEIEFAELLPFSVDINKKAVDLFFLASFIYGIDRFIERHPHSIDGWSRQLRVSFPVYELKLWKEHSAELGQLLSFLTGDYWTVDFLQNDLILPIIEIHEKHNLKFDQVSLFSGGLDSLIGSLDFLKSNPTKKLLLVSHFDPHISARQEQNELREKLSEKYSGGFDFIPSISVSLKTTNLGKEKTFRSRSLLFIGIAILVAEYYKISVLVPENGTVSLNFPLSSSRRSACSTRTTHPTFLSHVNSLLKKVGISSSIFNPYNLKTKGEMVSECKDLDILNEIVAISNSCGKRGHRANWTYKDKGHCGVCMPCIYRQAALYKISDTTQYGNTINKEYTGRKNQTPFLLSKQGQDFNACIDFLRKEFSDLEIRTELLINGVKDLEKLNEYVELVKRTRIELKDWIKKVGNKNIQRKVGFK